MDQPSLKDATIRGARWIAVASAASELAVLLGSIGLARLIPPSEFGYAALAVIIPVFGTVLGYEGLGSYLVQRASVTQAEVGTAHTLSIALGLTLSGLLLAFAATIGASIVGSKAASLTMLAAPTLLITAASATPRALLQRDLEFRRIGVAEAASVLVAVLTSVGLAAAGVDAEALVIGPIAGALAGTGLLYLARRPPISWDTSSAREVIRFGAPAAAAGCTYMGRRNIDYIILAAQMPAVLLGYYWRAFQLGVEYQGKITSRLSGLMFPVFARATGPEQLLRIRRRVLRLNAAIAVPALMLFIVIAPDFIDLLYGPNWQGAVLPAQILAVAGMALAIMSSTEPLLLATGRPRALLAFHGAFLVGYGAVIAATVPYGLTAVCIGAAAFHVIAAVASHYVVLTRIAGVPASDLLGDTLPATATGLAVAAVAGPVAMAARDVVPSVGVVLIATAFGAAVYWAFARFVFRSMGDDLVAIVKGMLRRRRDRGGDVGAAPSGEDNLAPVATAPVQPLA